MNTQTTKTEINFEKLQGQLDQWKAEIDKIEAKAVSASADAKLSYMREVENLKAKYAEAEAQLDDIRSAQEQASSDIMDGMTAAWSNLGDAVQKAFKRFD